MYEKIVYRLNDDISFRKCALFYGKGTTFGNCTSFGEKDVDGGAYYCNQQGLHFHCTRHPEIELDVESFYGTATLSCRKCNNAISINNIRQLINQSLRMLNVQEFRNAKLVRLDDWLVPEVKREEIATPEYQITTDVKTDKDGDTVVIIHIGHSGSLEKTRFFLKPEKCQLTSDYTDLDPAKILSKIEITLRDKTLSQSYDESF